MSESEEDELAALRKEREARLGLSGRTLTARRAEVEEQITHHKSIHNSDNNIYEDDVGGDLRAQFPMSFGTGPTGNGNDREQSRVEDTSKKNLDGEKEAFYVGAIIDGSGGEEENGKEDDSLGIVVGSNPRSLPVSSEAVMEPHGKAVISLDIDHSGSRLITGSTDYTVKIFDFNGMKSDCKPFRTIEPCEGHPVVSLSWSPTGDAFLVVTGSSQPKIYTRDGKEEGEFPRGDMYIRDMKNTKGHVTSCRGGQWHPTDKGTSMTCSDDGTIRIWDTWNLKQKTVIKPTLKRPGRVPVTSSTYNSDGRLIAAGLRDGTIQLWDVRGKFGQAASTGVVPVPKQQAMPSPNWNYASKSNQILRDAHEVESEITCLSIGLNSTSMLSRGADGTLKLWDLRKFKAPVAALEGLPTGFDNTQCCFSPTNDLVLTGVGASKEGSDGYLGIYDANDLTLVKRLGAPGNVVAVTWNPKINQIAIGCGNRREGTARILYDPALSHGGALRAIGRKPRKENMSDFTADIQPEIFNPNALPLYRQQWPGKKRPTDDLSIRSSKSFKPEIGQAGVTKGSGGQLGTTGGSLLTQYIMKNQGQLKNPAEEDVRASILRHADKEDEFSRFTEAYQKTQPTRMYASEENEEEEDQS